MGGLMEDLVLVLDKVLYLDSCLYKSFSQEVTGRIFLSLVLLGKVTYEWKYLGKINKQVF